jgi:predicted glycosyltransferase
MSRPRLLLWCQHSLGLGHLSRTLVLCEALRRTFDVTLLNGGRFPSSARVPAGVSVVSLPPLGHDPQFGLISHDPDLTVTQAQEARRAQILDAYEEVAPDVVLLELYPFGRKAFEPELLPLLERIEGAGDDRPLVISSLRDILVCGRDDQLRHDERVVRAANRFFDAILVHSDPTFAVLEESFRPVTPLEVPVFHTGFVAAGPSSRPEATNRATRVLVSTGGGMVGEPIVRAAVAAHPLVHSTTGLTTTVVAGPFLPDPVWAWLQEQAAASELLTAVRVVGDLAGQMRASAVSLSQAGYNTTMDLLRSRTPAVVVPYGDVQEDEQRRRSERLQELGVLTLLSPDDLGPARLAEAIATAASKPAPPTQLDLEGAGATERLLVDLVHARRPSPSPLMFGAVR